MRSAARNLFRRKIILIGISVYCALWAGTALFGLPDVDRKFDAQFAVGSRGLGFGDKLPESVPVIRIPFVKELRDVKAMSPFVPDRKPWRARTTGYAIAPFVIIDEVACLWGELAGLSAHRIVFWIFGFSDWIVLKGYWVA